MAGTLAALETVDEIALLCPLPEQSGEAIAQCERRRDRVAILSLPAGLGSVGEVLAARPSETSAFAAVHYPWVRAGGELTPPGGHVAGVYASGEVSRSPSGIEIRGLDDPPLERSLPSSEIAALVAGGVNPLRDFRAFGRGVRLWSARTLDPDLERRLSPRAAAADLPADLDRARLDVGRVGVQWRAALGTCAGSGRHVSDDAVAGRNAAGAQTQRGVLRPL